MLSVSYTLAPGVAWRTKSSAFTAERSFANVTATSRAPAS